MYIYSTIPKSYVTLLGVLLGQKSKSLSIYIEKKPTTQKTMNKKSRIE